MNKASQIPRGASRGRPGGPAGRAAAIRAAGPVTWAGGLATWAGWLAIWAVLSAAASAVAPAAASAGPAGSKAGFRAGPLHAVAPITGKIVRLTFEGERLGLDRAGWQSRATSKQRAKAIEDIRKRFAGRGLPQGLIEMQLKRLGMASNIQMLFQELRAACGAGGYSSSSSGQAYRMSFTGSSLAASLSLGGQEFSLRLWEQGSESRSLDVRQSGASLDITFLDPRDQVVILLRQDANGQVTLTDVRGEVVRTGRAKSFLAYYGRHRRYVEEELFPLLEHVGVTVDLGPNGPRAVEAVLAELRRGDGGELAAEARRLIADLDSGSYAQRQAATRKLAADYPRYYRFIDRALASPTCSTEARARLRLIVEQNGPRARARRLIAALGLADDPAYLVGLLDKTGGQDRRLIAARLEKLTGRKLGEDPAAWRRYLAACRPTSGPATAPAIAPAAEKAGADR
ncbi:MAG: hypothetical protein J7M21_05515 [Planctomycetes bacterium]|nr:hypothetical protein [Planctomycetota bacterium]